MKKSYISKYEYFNTILGFEKDSTRYGLLFMLKSLKKALYKGLCTGILLTNLLKAFDCISHDLLTAKLTDSQKNP